MGYDDPTIDMPSAAPARQGSMIGAAIGPYRLTALLGEGGFGTVYLGEQAEPLRRVVAVKVIRPGMDSAAVVSRFEAERQALALMDHPGVAKVFDAGRTEGGLPYFAMEYVRGRPIDEYCRDKRLGVEDQVRLMIEACEAVQHAHMRGLIHRDLKPGHVLVHEVEGRAHLKVIDFGIAKALGMRLTDSGVRTIEGHVLGTPEYMSPEQARGEINDLDIRVDVYALGAILYEVLTGSPPLDSETLRTGGFAGMQGAIERVVPVRPSERLSRSVVETSAARGDATDRARRLRGDLDWIVMKCLEKDRARRYDSVASLAADLKRYLAHEPVSAGPPSFGYRARKFVRRHRGPVAAALLVAAALVAGAIGATVGLVRANREWTRAEARTTEAREAMGESEAAVAFLADMLGSVQPDLEGRDVLVRDVLEHASGTIDTQFADRPLVQARLHHAIGNGYRGLGRLAEADLHLTMALEIRRRVQGPGHAATILALGNLAGLRQEQGRHAEAEALMLRAIEDWSSERRPTDETILGIMNNLAQAFSSQGRYEEAEALQRRAIDGFASVLGPDHPHTLGATANLSTMLEADGHGAEAEGMLRELIERWERVHGAEHPGTLLARHNLATLLLGQGQAATAEAMARELLEARERVLGTDHIDTIGTRATLGMAISLQGRAEEAAEIYGVAMADALARLGPTHPHTVTIAGNLLTALEAMGWPESGQEAVTKALEVLSVNARDGEATPYELNSLAWTLLTAEPESLRDAEGALRFASEACEREREAGGHDLWQYLDTLALAQHRAGRAVDAAASQREAIGLLPPAGEPYRGEMEARLHEYERASASADGPG